MGASLSCPYPNCARESDHDSHGACNCEYRLPILRCASCGMQNRSGALFCRACRAALPEPELRRGTLRGRVGTPLAMPGSFRRPPLAAQGFLYALAKNGALLQLSSREGAKAREIARVESHLASFNGSSLVNVQNAGGYGLPAGWTYLAVSQFRVEGISLAEAKLSTSDLKAKTIFEPQEPDTIVANRTEGESAACKGLAANSEFVAFVVRTEAGDNVLTLCYLHQDRPAERPLTLEGSQVAGPLMCERQIVFCTREQVGLYDQETQSSFTANFPSKFEPLLAPSSELLSIPAGSMPFAVDRRNPDKHTVLVAGVMGSDTGLLRVEFEENRKSFRKLDKPASFSTGANGIGCLALPETMEIFGTAEGGVHRARTHPGMPAYFVASGLGFFAETNFEGRHRVQLAGRERTVELPFDDPKCNEETCCGMYALGTDFVVAYLDIRAGDQGEGLKFSRWSPQ